MATFQKITPSLWFDNQAREAAEFYCSLFDSARVTSVSEMVVEFELEGLSFIGLNGGPKFNFTEAVSFLVYCDDQAEVDRLWHALTSNGGEESMCGWCKDKYGLSWQVVPKRFLEMMKTGTPEQCQRVMQAMMPMRKLIVEDFENAFRA